MAAMKKTVLRFHSDRGAELVEMMLVTPILLFMVAAIFDFGMLFRSWEVVSNAAREGARIASLPDYMANSENVRVRVEQYMQASGLASSCTIETLTGGGDCPAISACSVCVQNSTVTINGDAVVTRGVVVKSLQSMPALGAFAPLFGGSFTTIPVGGTSVMRTESQAGT
jgi:Flp pilus assembly protein TadG